MASKLKYGAGLTGEDGSADVTDRVEAYVDVLGMVDVLGIVRVRSIAGTRSRA